MKIAVVGGGSTYTPELVDGFARLAGSLAVTELALVDPAADRLDVIGPYARRLLAHHGHPGALTWTADLDAGLSGADVVVLQLRVGGQAARISDETFPLDCGCVGQETTGAGGLAKALRTVPVVLDIAERAARLANPGAWIVDFTNPVGIVTRALLDAGHRAIGLCNVAIGFQRRFAALLGVDPAQVTLDHVGLNHLTWERAAYVDGVDRLPELLRDHLPALADQVQLPADLLTRLGSVPSYYLRYFYAHDLVVREERGAPTRGEKVAGMESQLLAMYADPTLSTKPDLLSQRGGAFYSEAAVGLITSLVTGDGGVHAVNLRNDGHLPFLPDAAVIEVSARVDHDGAVPLAAPPVPPLMSGLISGVAAYEELAVRAAVHGGRDRVYDALLAHPLVGQYEQAEALTDKLLAANSAHLAWAR
ncbi:6-phospho-beta-glucosidase [Catellatospora tritici]|uniref:6-phospho-beta-glucosidase n=1 Tax=Catellatospora tritici TaxID=2851566 RepID=UPI001C2D6097|nr:6-phospho-beta-glucosidase [Catellatospora tritici]MBV1849460.1 6-phospho-beta-glucosidase [Catellatospora tritici]MBV1854032.1 6-phospho-beta-glucosidase [Catellatospora tritici]